MTGPGAAAAARGVLVALLLSHSGDRPRVVTTGDDLDTLLDRPTSWPQLPGLRVANSLADACAVLDAMVVDHPGRPVTIITAAPDDGLVRRLAALLTLGAGQGLSGVIVGAWPHRTTWQVEDDGRVDGAPGRLTTLTAAAALDLLTLTALRTAEHPTAQHPAGPAPPVSPTVTGPAENVRLRLSLLGQVTVTAGQGPVAVRRTAATQILVFLALHPAGATTAELCEALWPQLRPHTAAGRFYTTVSELRSVLRTATGGREVITHTGDRYQIDHHLVDTDVDRLLTAGRQATTATDRKVREAALRDVIDLYRGELAAGRTWPWLAPLREHVRREVINAHARLAADLPDQAARLWRDAARIDPVNEYLHHHAVHALIASGDHHAARLLSDDHARHLAAANLEKASDQAV
ncbi:AfsR/SARP family transcriptional regulator [Phytohabitans sp. LJ34]|uniref:AfsR/SARP family transcriptional regulator n=1 Tax=Phytohabitans sp. LJ34 TaxID=3452217 RepID=UPI003F8957DC